MLSILAEVDGIDNPSVLDMDAFGLLVGLTFSLPHIFNGGLPSGNIQDRHLLQLVFVVHLVQIMLTTDQWSSLKEEKEDQDHGGVVLELLHDVRKAVGFASDNDGSEGLKAKAVWGDLKHASLPFLRCAALFYHHLTNVPGPSELAHFAPNEFDVLAKYLGLPSNPGELLAFANLRTLAVQWASHPGVAASLSAGKEHISYPLKLNSLIKLPADYSELINNVSNFTCPNYMSDESRVPAMCLICGEVVCSQSYCCQTTIGKEFKSSKE